MFMLPTLARKPHLHGQRWYVLLVGYETLMGVERR